MTTPSNRPSVAETLGVDPSSAQQPRGRRVLLWVGAVIALALVAVAWSMLARGEEPRYVTQPVQRGTLAVTIAATGHIEPTNQVDMSSELSGIIKTVDVDADDRVKVGQILARLDTSKLEAQAQQSKAALDAARARLRQVQATVEEARNQLARLEHVRVASGGKVPSQQELEAAVAALRRGEADEANAMATIAQAEATLSANRTDLGKAVLRSPINGVVLKRSVEPGQTVASSFQAPVLFTIAEDLTKMELRVDVDEADIGQVQPGQDATFTVDAHPGRTFTARVTTVRFGSQTVEGVVTYETILDVDNSDLSLRPGMTATTDVTVKKTADTVLIPNAALRFIPAGEATSASPAAGQGGGLLGQLLPRRPSSTSPVGNVNANGTRSRVWVVQDGRPVAVPITLGATNGSQTEVVAGDIRPEMDVIVGVVGGA